MFDLIAYLQSRRYIVNQALEKSLDTDPLHKSRVMDAATYSLMAGGKRIRPILCIAAAEAVGGKAEYVLSTACAIEMIHTYSLIHDDLPAMDNDKLRRGKPTCHLAFDEATAVLAGDALLTLAFYALSAIDFENGNRALRQLRVIRMVSQAAGYEGMVGGQMRDIESENKLLTFNQLKEVHALKTGALIVASTCAGALLGDGTPEQIKQIGLYAENIGLAFQVTDDILNVEGDPKQTGKAVGTDMLLHKNTYPSLIGIDQSKRLAKKLIKNALQAIELFDNKCEPLRAIAKYIVKRKE